MKKQIAAMIGAAVMVTVTAGFLYRGCGIFSGGTKGDDQRTGSEPLVLPFLSREVVPPNPDVALIQKNLEAKDEVAREVIAGRMTLAEAAARFRTIDASRPPHLPVHLDVVPGSSDEERICRQVIAYVENNLEGRPDRDAVLARLEADLRRHLEVKKPIGSPTAPVRPVKVAD
jgi:hypothetical protein